MRAEHAVLGLQRPIDTLECDRASPWGAEPRIGSLRQPPTSLKRGTAPPSGGADFCSVASPVHGPPAVRGFLAALAAAAAVYVAYAALELHENETLAGVFDNWVYYGLLLGAAGACLARTHRRRVGGPRYPGRRAACFFARGRSATGRLE